MYRLDELILLDLSANNYGLSALIVPVTDPADTRPPVRVPSSSEL